MLFYFDFGNYFRMLRLAWKEPNTRARRYYLAVLVFAVPVVASFHAICFALDGVLFPGLWRTEIRTPVFVVGHARSGTTLVHRLLSKDAGRFSSFMLYELYFPSLVQKKVIRALAALDLRCGGRLHGWARAWDEKRYGKMRGVHAMGLTEYEEDDIVFYYSCASGFWITKMPYLGDLDFYSVDEWPARKRRRMMRFYRDCVRRQLYLNGGERVHLSKNPVFAGRVRTLIECFPDARVVVPLRNPFETIPSLLKLMRMGWKRMGWAAERQERCLRILADQSFHTYLHPLEVLESAPHVRHAVVDYERLQADPAAAIEAIYRDLGFPLGEDYRALLGAEGSRASKHRSGHSYSLEEFGLEADEIRRRLAPLFERYDWTDRTDEERPSPTPEPPRAAEAEA